MSLKAKLEAVIYAAEEPVTLAQLAGLFAVEALEWKAGQDAAAQAQAGGPDARSVPEEGTLPLLGEAFEDLQPDKRASEASGSPAGASGVAAEEATLETNGAGGESEDQSAGTTSEAGATDEAAVEAESKRAARLREREARGAIRQLLDELIAEYATDGRGIEIREIAGGYRMATKPECHDAVRSFVKSLKPALKLSMPALETLAVIAYKQPVTAPEVNEIRGVDSSGVFGSLLARKLIVTAGRKPVVGRPILYKTTREFLLRFGLKDVSELPSMEEFEKMAASELDEPELAQKAATADEVAPEFNPDPNLERDEVEPSAAESESNPSDSAQSGEAASGDAE